MDWCLYDRDLRHGRIKIHQPGNNVSTQQIMPHSKKQINQIMYYLSL